jgi:hypothetical protein
MTTIFPVFFSPARAIIIAYGIKLMNIIIFGNTNVKFFILSREVTIQESGLLMLAGTRSREYGDRKIRPSGRGTRQFYAL